MMMRTMPAVRHHLAATFLFALGLIASGCGSGSAPANPVNPVNPVQTQLELASLSVATDTTTATLQPAFSPATMDYDVDLSSDVQSVTVIALPAVPGHKVGINDGLPSGSSIPLNPPGDAPTVVRISVAESDTNAQFYDVTITRAGPAGNNSLQSLTVPPGILTPTFDPNLQAYTASVPSNIGSVTVTSTLSGPTATMTVNGQTALSGQGLLVPLKGNLETTAITVAVKAQNGAPKNYQVAVSRGISNNANLGSLSVSQGSLSPTFSPSIVDYSVNVASGVENVTITAAPQDSAAHGLTINGVPSPTLIDLGDPGSTTLVTLVVTAQNNQVKHYGLQIIRATQAGTTS
ncbi:MAG: hypothetical protein CV081_08190 [Nitrospira sp. LK265]|nr:cadherin-like beta sandwich domain-containing protein [Nitrospira sp.]NGZ60467.1 hypothetical protein [Nitrospira sp. LK265]